MPPGTTTLPLRIALLGAESTGKSTLAVDLAQWLCARGVPAVAVPEYLRAWCDTHGRTPQPHEQPAIAHEQARRVLTAANGAVPDGPRTPAPQVVIADTTPLMTAIYSDMLFDDRSLYPFALDHQRHYQATLVAGLDVPWVADGLQRDGPHVRDRVDGLIRQHLEAAQVRYQVVYGLADERLASALAALAPVLTPLLTPALARVAPPCGSPDATRLIANYSIPSRVKPSFSLTPSGSAAPDGAWYWVCERCGDADCEHRSRRRQ